VNARAHSNMSYTSYPYSVDPMRTPPREGQEEIALIKLGWRVLRGRTAGGWWCGGGQRMARIMVWSSV
jgi:hypothetical protein